MPAPTPSRLDHQQCIQGSYDETTGRLRVDAAISASIIAAPGLEVSISSIDDSILVVGTEDGTKTGTQHVLKVGSDLNLRVKDDASNTSLASIDSKLVNLNTTAVKTIQLFTKSYDAIVVTYPSATQEVYVSKTGGISGTTQQTATVNYVDSTKANLLNVAVV